MSIRFYIPLPGPFAWVPGRKHPRHTNTGPSLTDKVGDYADRDRRQHAINFAEFIDYPDTEQFADTVDEIHSRERSLWSFAGVIVGLLLVVLMAGPGSLILMLVPVIGFPFLAIAVTPAVIASCIACRRTRVFGLACRKLRINKIPPVTLP